MEDGDKQKKPEALLTWGTKVMVSHRKDQREQEEREGGKGPLVNGRYTAIPVLPQKFKICNTH